MELEIVRRFYSDIQNAVMHNIVGIAALLYQEGVVAEEVVDEARLSKPPAEKTVAILQAVSAAVKIDSKTFWVLLSVLEKFPVTACLANRVKDAVDLHSEWFVKRSLVVRFSGGFQSACFCYWPIYMQLQVRKPRTDLHKLQLPKVPS